MHDRPPLANAYLHTIDLCLLRYNRDSGELDILLHQRDSEPFAGHWALPGIVVNGDVEDRSLNDAVERLRRSSKVDMPLAWLEQVGTVGDAFRDPRCWSSSTFYLGIASEPVQPGPQQGFFSLREVASGTFKLPFDHNSLVAQAHERLLSKSLYSSLPLMFLGNEFSAPEAVAIFSIVLQRPVLKTSIRQRLLKMSEAGYLRDTGRKKSGDGGRPQATLDNLKPEQVYLFDRCFLE
ncbi:NUDIX hydrolase [Pseudomonas sessilinigenes]|uniref:NUDIX hydrolase n=1 Tax=Pseudomonas sessilinigenes TaxID=658629 RepID=A0ABX8MWL5_9PSED|nr:NUDIX hydrolase [Pseudomonas sessilinigenes]AZC24051.1 Nudix-related transcriptional regulator NrtR [Pseudomonas sessilinigenes]QXH43013.1 NUDIX hydrolase [Pseudomonas sessilinigenes]